MAKSNTCFMHYSYLITALTLCLLQGCAKSDEQDDYLGVIETPEYKPSDESPLMPDFTQAITLNTGLTTLPPHCKFNADNFYLQLSYRGGAALLYFDGNYDKKLEVLTSDPRLQITPQDTRFKNQQIQIDASQIEEGEAYTVKFRLSNALLATHQGVVMTIHVDNNKIPSVAMGGLTWMAYNGVGKDRSLYPPLEIDQTVRDVLKTQWRFYSAMSAWGPRPQMQFFYPEEFVRSTILAGNGIVPPNMPWTDEYSSSVPCPDGWRIPTYAEYAAIWPGNGLAIPGNYVRNSIKYSIAKEESGAQPIVGSDGNNSIRIATQLLVISDGTNELLFPMAGWRIRDDYGSYKPAFAIDAGNAFYLWTQNLGPNYWNAVVVGVNKNSTAYYHNGNNQQAFKEAFNTTRCVKK